MRIKKILLSGFKSYKSQEKFDDFHPCTNVLVGKNGSGKSNLIFGTSPKLLAPYPLAIRFLLSNEFKSLRTEERKALLHQGKDGIISGYVEIHFDNTDKRFPVESTEVRLRRVIGVSKADYYLNGKHISADDVMNLLESAGFSRSNPYYIVQQGKVQALSKMKPTERLELLREVAGTRVYDERREESTRIMDDTASKREKIDEVLAFLDERLEELEKEKEELKDYQEQDRNRRVLEYTIYTKELADVNKKLEELEDTHLRDIQDMEKLHKEAQDVYEELKASDKELKAVTADLEKLTKQKEFLQAEAAEYDKIKARMDLQFQGSKAALSNDSKKRSNYMDELNTLKKEIAKSQKALDRLQPEFAKAQKREQEVKETILDNERRVQELISKQGRAAQFSSVKERDAWIVEELKSLEATVKAKQKQTDALKAEIADQAERTKEERKALDSRAENAERHKQERDTMNEDFNTLKAKRNQTSDRRKELWRQESEMETEITQHKEALAKAQRQLYGTISREVVSGIEAVKRIKKEHDMKGVYAPIIELFTCTEKEMTAVEVASKGSLFNFVVDTDATASKLLELYDAQRASSYFVRLNKEKAGRVTFMPLNKLAVKEPSYPRTETTLPMIDRLKFKSMFRKAFLHIFGRTLLCSSIEEAAGIAKTHNMDCITIEGDQINRKGALSGGFHDIRKSRLALMSTIRSTTKSLADAEEKLEKIKADVAATETLITRLVGEMQDLEKARAKSRDEFESFQSDSISAHKRILQLESSRIQRSETLNGLEMTIRQLQESIRTLKAEKGTKLVSKLDTAEEKELNNLNTKLSTLRVDLAEVTNARADLQAKTKAEELKLSEHLFTRQEELEKEISSLELVEETVNLDQSKIDLTALQSSIQKHTEEFEKVQKEIVTATDRVYELKENVENLREQEEQSRTKLQDESKSMEKLLNNRSVFLQKREDCQKKLRDIGSLPSKSQKDFQDKDLSQLLTLLHKTKKELRAYSHVNKKALDQYVHFKDQRETLEDRKVELDESEQAIKTLIAALDEKKGQAIERTFKMVAKFFSEVFTELTGDGTAHLVMQKRAAREDEEEEASIQHYTGIDIKVSFSKSGKQQRMQQLSGGQQSLVALALIFAIQRCDPAPFYVFDEIDFALDDTYRLSVAEMIKRQSMPKDDTSEGTQFICTTHRPELVNAAHKHYIIKYRNKVSNVVSCEAQDALELLEGEEERAVEGEESEYESASFDDVL